MFPLIEWYVPWSRLDMVLRVELIIWIVVVGASCWIYWRSVIRGKPWLQRRKRK